MSAPSARYRAALSSLLTGDLWTSDGEEGLRPEQAALHLASVQAKALLLAIDNEQGSSDRGPGAWEYGHRWTQDDTLTALAGLVSFLEGSRVVLEGMRNAEGFVDSGLRRGCYPHPAAAAADSERALQNEIRRNGGEEPCACEADESEARP